jgi:hypothetical protein
MGIFVIILLIIIIIALQRIVINQNLILKELEKFNSNKEIKHSHYNDKKDG